VRTQDRPLTLLQQARRSARQHGGAEGIEECIAGPDLCVEVGERRDPVGRLSADRAEHLQPEAQLANSHGAGVSVHAVKPARHQVAHACQLPRPGTVEQSERANQKGARADRWIEDVDVQHSPAQYRIGIVERLTGEAILNDFVRIREESRTNTAVLDPTTGLHTEINERGPSVSAQELDLFRDKLLYLAKGASICVFAGSLPRGVAPEVYGRLIRDVRKLGVLTMIDTDGEPLRLAVKGEPAVVSPNELEAEELVGHEFNDAEDRAQAVIEMSRLGAREAIMTVADGCYARILDDAGIAALHRVRVEEQEARSAVGSGDAFLAGYVAARYTGRAAVDCLRFGVACGAESTQHFGAGIVDPGKVEKLLAEVASEQLDIGAHIS